MPLFGWHCQQAQAMQHELALMLHGAEWDLVTVL